MPSFVHHTSLVLVAVFFNGCASLAPDYQRHAAEQNLITIARTATN